MVRIYGCSDDLIEIDGSKYDNEIGCNYNNPKVRMWFEDGTVIRVSYGKKDLAIWDIVIEEVGTARFDLWVCNDEDAEIYSDIFEIDSEIIRHENIS